MTSEPPCALLQGIVISCCLICAVLFCSAAWDYILQYWAAFAPHVLPALDREALHPEDEQVPLPTSAPDHYTALYIQDTTMCGESLLQR